MPKESPIEIVKKEGYSNQTTRIFYKLWLHFGITMLFVVINAIPSLFSISDSIVIACNGIFQFWFSVVVHHKNFS